MLRFLFHAFADYVIFAPRPLIRIVLVDRRIKISSHSLVFQPPYINQTYVMWPTNQSADPILLTALSLSVLAYKNENATPNISNK